MNYLAPTAPHDLDTPYDLAVCRVVLYWYFYFQFTFCMFSTVLAHTAVYHNFLDFFATSFLTARSCHEDR